MTEIDPRALRNAFGTFMTGVTVVTAYGADGMPIGFTANSFTSVSLDPPLLLVCVANNSSNYKALTNASGFAVNVLSEGQKHVSNTFARPVEDRFSVCGWKDGPNGSPVLDDVSAWFDCAMHKLVEAGDHVILIGRVAAFYTSTAPGLGYVRGAYVTAASEVELLSGYSDIVVSALIERDGQVLLQDDGAGGLDLPDAKIGKGGAIKALQSVISDCGVSATPGFVYSVFEDTEQQKQHICFLCQAESGIPARGAFVQLDDSALNQIAQGARRKMLARFARESRMGNYGVYFGDQHSGEVRPTVSEIQHQDDAQ